MKPNWSPWSKSRNSPKRIPPKNNCPVKEIDSYIGIATHDVPYFNAMFMKWIWQAAKITKRDDNIHYDAPGLLALGKRAAKAYIRTLE